MRDKRCESIPIGLNKKAYGRFIKKIIYGFFTCLMLLNAFRYTALADDNSENELNTSKDEETIELSLIEIDVLNEAGSSILIKDGQIYYTKEDLFFKLPSKDNCKYEMEISESCDKGVSFSEYSKIEGDCYRFKADENKDRVTMLKFRVKEIADVTTVKESKVFMVGTDYVNPVINFSSSQDMSKWSTDNIECHVEIVDEISGIAKIEISNNSGIILNTEDKNEACGIELFDPSSAVTEYSKREVIDIMLTDEANDITGNKLNITVEDLLGNKAYYESSYYIDKSMPQLTFECLNSSKVFSYPPELNISVEDNADSAPKIYYSASRQNGPNPGNVENIEGSFDEGFVLAGNYSEEGDYHLEAYVMDLAGNTSEKKTIDYRLDCCGPEILIKGVSNEGVYKEGKTIEFEVRESFFEDAHAYYEVIRKKGSEVASQESENIKLSSETTLESISVSEDGEYHVSLKAGDMAGNESSEELVFYIDSQAPLISFNGTKDNQITNKAPEVNIHVSDNNYEGSRVIASLFKKDENGKYNSITKPEFVMNANECDFYLPIEIEGIYKLRVLALDKAGNSTREEINLTLDYTPPTFEGLSEYQKAYLQKFKVNDGVMSTIDDLTNVSLKAYLNSKEYNPSDEVVQEGKYVLKFELMDEAGNVTDESVTFIVDSTKPELIISGLREDGTCDKNSKIEISLYEEADNFTLIKLNGKELKADNNKTASFLLPDYGEYELYVEAEDEAKNILLETVTLNCALSQAKEKEHTVVKSKKKSFSSSKESVNEIKVISTEKEEEDKSNFGRIAIIVTISILLLVFLSVLGIIISRVKSCEQ